MLSSCFPNRRAADQLLPVLGVGFGVAVTVGSTVGVGILRIPGEVAALTGSVALALTVWMLGGVYALLGANYTAELATMVPKAGGPYVFGHHAYGDFGGFVIGVCDWGLNTAALAFLAIAFGEFAAGLIRGMSPSPHIIAVCVLLLFTMLNATGIRAGSRTQTLTSALSVLALLAFVTACLVVNNEVSALSAAAAEPNELYHTSLRSLAVAFQLVLGTYGGWNAAVYFAEEDRAPSRNLPRSLFSGVIVVTAVYLLVNVGLLVVLPLPALAASDFPAATAMEALFGNIGGTIVRVVAMLLLLGIINAGFLTMPRTLFAASRDGLGLRAASTVNTGGTPIVALAITSFTAITFAATGTFVGLLGLYAIVGVLMNLLLAGAVVVLRRRAPALPRPFKTRGYPIAIVVLVAVDVAILAALTVADTTKVMAAMLLLTASYPVYRLTTARRPAVDAGSAP